MTENSVRPVLPVKRDKRVVENNDFAAFTRRVLRAYARRIAAGDIEAIRGLRQLACEVDAATAEAVKGLRCFGYSWSDIAARLGVSRQAAQMRWADRTDRGRLDDRMLDAGLGVTPTVLVTVFADHFRDPLVGSCPGCGFVYRDDASECPTAATVRPLLYRRRNENPQALARLTPDQLVYLHDRRGSSERRSVPSADSGSSLLETTGGGR